MFWIIPMIVRKVIYFYDKNEDVGNKKDLTKNKFQG